jgi:hypothetical protein
MHAFLGERARNIDAYYPGVWMRGPENGRMQGARLHGDIVAVATTSRKDGCILKALHRPTDMAT